MLFMNKALKLIKKNSLDKYLARLYLDMSQILVNLNFLDKGVNCAKNSVIMSKKTLDDLKGNETSHYVYTCNL